MASGELVFQLPRPPLDVWAVVSDLERAPEWVPDLISVTKLSAGEVCVGSRFTQVVRVAGNEGTAELEITEFDPPRAFAHRGSGPSVEFTATFTLEPDPSGTKITHAYTFKLSGMMRVMEPMVAGWMRKNAEASIECLKQLFEDERAGG